MTTRPRRTPLLLLLVGGLAVAAVLALQWDLSAITSAAGRQQAWHRLGSFVAAFGSPDLSGTTLQYALSLAAQTLAIALLGTALGAVLGYPLALGAAHSVVVGDEPPGVRRLLSRAVAATCRLALDVLRGVPDFAWALLILTGPGPGPVTAILAIGVNVAGILGKIYSELWDAVEPARYRAIRSTGAGRLSVLLYGIQPLAGRAMLSYTLMRAECAIRNASVIGVVSGGGLGSAILDELNFGNDRTVITLLLFTLALTASSDILANLFRYQLRTDPNHPKAPRDSSLAASRKRRRRGLFALALALLASALLLTDGFRNAWQQLDRLEPGFVSRWFGLVLRPDLSAATLAEAARESVVPLAMGWLATLGAVAIAACLAFPASYAFQVDVQRFTGEATTPGMRIARGVTMVFARSLALLFRGIPEVAWVLILAAFFRMGMVPGLIGITVHSAGVLLRVFTETVDDIPYRRFEHASYGSRATTFLYAAVPISRPAWMTYALFQFEVNVRAGIVLGIIGVGGLGDAFDTSMKNFNEVSLPRAGTFLLAMVLLTVLIDRISRRLKTSRVGC